LTPRILLRLKEAVVRRPSALAPYIARSALFKKLIEVVPSFGSSAIYDAGSVATDARDNHTARGWQRKFADQFHDIARARCRIYDWQKLRSCHG